MSRQISLAELRAEADTKFGDLDVDGVIFRSLLRLGDKARKTAAGMLKQIGALQGDKESVEAESLETLSKLMRSLMALVATDTTAANRLIGQMDDAEVMTLLTYWNETAQAGEASSSPS